MILIRAAVQICSRDFRPCRMDIGRHGRILHSPGAFRNIENAGLTFQGCRDCFCGFLRQTKSRWHRKILRSER